MGHRVTWQAPWLSPERVASAALFPAYYCVGYVRTVMLDTPYTFGSGTCRSPSWTCRQVTNQLATSP